MRQGVRADFAFFADPSTCARNFKVSTAADLLLPWLSTVRGWSTALTAARILTLVLQVRCRIPFPARDLPLSSFFSLAPKSL